MDGNERTPNPVPTRIGDATPTRRRIIRAVGGGFVAALAVGGLAACGGDVTEDELEDVEVED